MNNSTSSIESGLITPSDSESEPLPKSLFGSTKQSKRAELIELVDLIDSSEESINYDVNLEELADEIFHIHIFSYLNLSDLFMLKITCKRFYLLVESYEIKQLSFMNYDIDHHFEDYRDNWFSTTEPIKLRNQGDFFELGLLKNQSVNKLSNLRMRNVLCGNPRIRLDDLCKFTKLRILDLRGITVNFDAYLELPNLTAFSFDFKLRKNRRFIIKAPNLYSLNVDGRISELIDTQIKFIHPLSIRYIRTREYFKNASIFKNLECLQVLMFSNLKVNDLEHYKLLKKLKMNHFQEAISMKPKKILECLIYAKKKFPALILCGVKIKNIDTLRQFDEQSNIEFQLNNYSRLDDDLYFVRTINYNIMMRLLPPKLPADLFKKYTNIQEMHIVGRIEDEDKLVNFIRQCNNLYKLIIKKSTLSQKFYDRLTAISSLFELNINDIDYINNLNFINRMPYLISLFLHRNVRLDKDFNLNNLKILKKFTFLPNSDKYFEIIKEDRDEYSIILNGKRKKRVRKEYFNLRSLIRFFNDYRNQCSHSKKRKI